MCEPRLARRAATVETRWQWASIRGPLEQLRGDGERADFASEFIWNQTSACGGPIFGGKFDKALFGPMSQYAQEVAEVGLWVKAMQFCRSDEGKNVSSGVRVVVASNKEPGFAADRDGPQRAFGTVV